jgi:hypothetical protein
MWGLFKAFPAHEQGEDFFEVHWDELEFVPNLEQMVNDLTLLSSS